MSGVDGKDGPNTELEDALNQLSACQKDMDKINKICRNDMLNLEEEFEKLRKPLYNKRNTAIKRLPNFWGTSFNNNPHLAKFMGNKGFQFIKNLQVENFENIKNGYRIHLHFYENPYFENEVLTKEIRLRNSKNENWVASTSTPIKWKKGMQYTAWPRSSTKTTYENFFDWFLDNENPDFDHIGDLIRDDLWINPLRYYCLDAPPENYNNEEKKKLEDEQTEDITEEEDNEEENEDNLHEQNEGNLSEEDVDNFKEKEDGLH